MPVRARCRLNPIQSSGRPRYRLRAITNPLALATAAARVWLPTALIVCAIAVFGLVEPAFAFSRSQINQDANTSLATLYRTTPGAEALADRAKGVLIFPRIVKGGFIVAGQYGDGVLRKAGKNAGYYRSISGSVGFQAGAQAFGYVLFFMDKASLRYLHKSGGWELGTGPSLVVLDKGFGKNISTTTMQSGVYAFIFNQQGLMGGIGIQGSKITRIHPD